MREGKGGLDSQLESLYPSSSVALKLEQMHQDHLQNYLNTLLAPPQSF